MSSRQRWTQLLDSVNRLERTIGRLGTLFAMEAAEILRRELAARPSLDVPQRTQRQVLCHVHDPDTQNSSFGVNLTTSEQWYEHDHLLHGHPTRSQAKRAFEFHKRPRMLQLELAARLPNINDWSKIFSQQGSCQAKDHRACAEQDAYHRLLKQFPSTVLHKTKMVTIRYLGEGNYVLQKRCPNCLKYKDLMGEAYSDYAHDFTVLPYSVYAEALRHHHQQDHCHHSRLLLLSEKEESKDPRLITEKVVHRTPLLASTSLC